MAEKQILLQAKSLQQKYTQNEKSTYILDNLDVTIYAGDFTVIMGASGAGKSTFLYTLSGLKNATNGSIFYKEKDITKFSEKQMATLRSREFGFVFQDTRLISNLTLQENVLVAGYCSNQNENVVKQKCKEFLTAMNIIEAKDRLPSQVSGGEAQRAALARAVINNPGLLFADEPTGALNKKNTTEVLELLLKLNKAGQSTLMVTHDIRAALYGNRILYLEDGKILDELNLPHEEKNREQTLTSWLNGLQW